MDSESQEQNESPTLRRDLYILKSVAAFTVAHLIFFSAVQIIPRVQAVLSVITPCVPSLWLPTVYENDISFSFTVGNMTYPYSGSRYDDNYS